ncbi:hypothetical protein ACSBR2_008405 [Camellia fascicularis]
MCWFVPPTVVHIINSLPANSKPLLARCQSRDDDFGMHTLTNGQEFYWRFYINFFGSTLFFCHFYWDTKDVSQVVFDNRIFENYCQTPHTHDDNCYWSVRSDGFYLSDDNSTWSKQYDWS